MATLAQQILRVPGRLAVGCTDLTTAWPHGGTALGPVKEVFLKRFSSETFVPSEEFGGSGIGMLAAGHDWALLAFARGWNDEVVSRVFRSVAAGATSQHQVVSEPGTCRAGEDITGLGAVIVFTPEGSTHAWSRSTPDAKAPFVVLYNAIPRFGDLPEIPLQRANEVGQPVEFRGIRDTSSRVMASGRRKDLTL